MGSARGSRGSAPPEPGEPRGPSAALILQAERGSQLVAEHETVVVASTLWTILASEWARRSRDRPDWAWAFRLLVYAMVAAAYAGFSWAVYGLGIAVLACAPAIVFWIYYLIWRRVRHDRIRERLALQQTPQQAYLADLLRR